MKIKTILKVAAGGRRFLSVVILAVMSSVACHAQYVGLEVKMPKISKVIEVTTDGVNMRQSPSAAAPRLMYQLHKNFDIYHYLWSNERMDASGEWDMDKIAVSASKGERFIVVNEADEWYGVMACETHFAYISKKFAREVALTPIMPEMLTSINFYGTTYSQSPGITKGAYRGYACMFIEQPQIAGLMYGRIVDGLLVFNLLTGGGFSYKENVGRLSVGTTKFFATVLDDNGNEMDGVDIKFGDELYIKYVNEYGTPFDVMVMDRLTDDEFAGILEKAKPLGTQRYVCVCACIGGEVTKIGIYDTKSPGFAGMMATVPAAVAAQPETAAAEPSAGASGGADEATVAANDTISPEFPGGKDALNKFIAANLRYPLICAENRIQGRVVVNFAIDERGMAVDLEVTESPDKYLSNEAMRIIRVMPRWKPGTVGGRPVKVKCIQSFVFNLN